MINGLALFITNKMKKSSKYLTIIKISIKIIISTRMMGVLIIILVRSCMEWKRKNLEQNLNGYLI